MNGKDGKTDKAVETRLLTLAGESLTDMDPSVTTRLAAMRREAVRIAEAAEPDATWLDRLLGPAGLVTAAAALSVVVAAWVALRPTGDALAFPLLSEPEIAVVQDLELLEELEFLAWLEEEEPDGAG